MTWNAYAKLGRLCQALRYRKVNPDRMSASELVDALADRTTDRKLNPVIYSLLCLLEPPNCEMVQKIREAIAALEPGGALKMLEQELTLRFSLPVFVDRVCDVPLEPMRRKLVLAATRMFAWRVRADQEDADGAVPTVCYCGKHTFYTTPAAIVCTNCERVWKITDGLWQYDDASATDGGTP